MAGNNRQSTSIRDRVVDMVRVSASELRANPGNWREHPTHQREALRTVLGEIGFAGAVLAYRDDNGGLVLIDGHLRVEELGGGEVPVLVTDLTAAEADTLLAVYDPIGAMAKANEAAHKRLLEGFAGQGEALARLGEAFGANYAAPSADDWSAAFGGVPDEDRSPFQQMTFTLHDDQVETVKAAIRKANLMGDYVGDNANSNGNALARICEVFLSDEC